MKSSLARKQRKAFYNAPLHRRGKMMVARLDIKLIEKYNHNIRSVHPRKGDTVRVIRGDKDIRKHEGKIAEVDTRARKIVVEGITIPKADGKQKPFPIDPSNTIITKLDLSDPLRRKWIEKRAKVTIKEEELEEKETKKEAREKEETGEGKKEREETEEEVAEMESEAEKDAGEEPEAESREEEKEDEKLKGAGTNAGKEE